MATRTDAARRTQVGAGAIVVLGLIALWLGQPFLPGWGCAASLPGSCSPHVLPVRASAISAGILLMLLAVVVIAAALQRTGARWAGAVSRWVAVAVPVILVATVVAHFVIPQP